MYTTLPKKEKTIDFEAIGESTGFDYKGSFTIKCILTMAEKHQMEVEKSRLMADLRNPTIDLLEMAISLSEARARIIQGPAWWKESNYGQDLLDSEVLITLANKCLNEETEWKKSLVKKAEEVAPKND